MKTYIDILEAMISSFISRQEKVTYFGKDSVIRAILSAIAGVIAELYADVFKIKRNMQPSLAIGADLDILASNSGLVRKEATKSSVVLVFNSTSLVSSIPIGTQVKGISGDAIYETKEVVTFGNNSFLSKPILSSLLGDSVIAESLQTGSKTKVIAREIKELVTPIAGISVINLAPSDGGEDAESDELLRERIIGQINLLAQGTQPFYDQLAKTANIDVLRSISIFDPQSGGTKIYVTKRNYGQFLPSELITMGDYIYKNQRALLPIKVENIEYLGVEIGFTIKGFTRTLNDIYSDTAIKFAEYLDAKTASYGFIIKYQEILKLALEVEGIGKIDLGTMTINGTMTDIFCGSYQLPKFSKLTINYISENVTVSNLL